MLRLTARNIHAFSKGFYHRYYSNGRVSSLFSKSWLKNVKYESNSAQISAPKSLLSDNILKVKKYVAKDYFNSYCVIIIASTLGGMFGGAAHDYMDDTRRLHWAEVFYNTIHGASLGFAFGIFSPITIPAAIITAITMVTK